ncbi:MAG: cell division protein FtsQ/DivIB [bacterium]|nr:FtsQ-type POTRA domain-containing protein [Gammaproteobacteria bacterium]HIL98816.1 FtsQ-type POTRA domain-containing protein [Pseudomonadales bacterium]
MKFIKLFAVIACFFSLIAVIDVVNNQVLDVNYVSVGGSINDGQRRDVYRQLASTQLVNPSIAGLRQEVETISWVSRAVVERKWPDSVFISVVPQKAIALWNDDAFINDAGQVFFSGFELSSYQRGRHLAQLYGPPGSERKVMQQYQQLNNALLKTGSFIEVLTLDERGAWSFTNDTGIEVMLGKEELMERIQRLLIVSENIDLTERQHQIRKIDTRYSNGVAVSWKKSMEGIDLAKTFKSQRELKL